MAPLVWLITGCSSGIGHALAEAALARGELVIATTRAPVNRLQDLQAAGASILELDVTADKAHIEQVVNKAIDIYGRIDVVVPNAGSVTAVFLEALTYVSPISTSICDPYADGGQARAVEGPVGRDSLWGDKSGWCCTATSSSAESGTIAFTNSVWSYATTYGCGPYAMSKHAIAAYAKTLAVEGATFGIKPICFDIGYIRTPILSKSSIGPFPAGEEYKPITEGLKEYVDSLSPIMPGSPDNCAERIIDTVHNRERKTMFVPLGTDALLTLRSYAQSLLDACDEHEQTAKSVDFPEEKQGFFAQVPHYWNIPQSA